MTERSGPRFGRWRASPATYALSVACGVVFVATLALCAAQTGAWGFMATSLWRLDACNPAIVDLGGLAVARVWLDGEAWRVLTAGLLHGSILHLVLNIWSLIVVGEWAERAVGSRRLAALFVLTSVLGCVASQAYAEAPLIVGASAGIMGIAGALLVWRLFAAPSVRARLDGLSARGLGIATVVLVALGFFVPFIAQAGHLGGLAGGFAIGWAFSRRRFAWLGWVGALGLGLGLGWGAAHPRWRAAHGEYLGFELLDRGEHAAGAAALEAALAERGGDPELSNGVAYGYAEAGVELERAQELVERSLADDPERADYLDTLGWIHCRAGRPEAGLPLLREASERTDGGVPEIEAHVRECASAGVAADVSRETP